MLSVRNYFWFYDSGGPDVSTQKQNGTGYSLKNFLPPKPISDHDASLLILLFIYVIVIGEEPCNISAA
jgi:hypothetical protein